MTRRYLLAIVDGGGNVPPELHVARRLVERGHSVTVLAEDSVADEVRATGAVLRRWAQAPNRPDRRPEHDLTRDWECRYPWQLVARLVSTVFVGPAERYARDVREAMSDTKPDLLVGSMFCLGGMIAAEAAGRPFDVLFPNVYVLPTPGLPPFGLGLIPARGALGRWRDSALNGFTERLWDWHGLAGLNAVRRQHGLGPLDRFLDQVRRARRHLVLTSPDFDFPAAFPGSVRYVGPVLDDPVWAQATSWTPPAGSDPLVLVAMSSTFQDQTDCLQRVLEALATLPVRGVLTTGPAIHPSAVRPPAHVEVVSRAPHQEVLRHASLVVTHAGHGTVMKALAAGVPLAMLPHGRDQADTAVRVTTRGAGLVLKRSATPHAIANAIRQLLQRDSFRIAARQLGAAIRRDANQDLLLQELEAIQPADIQEGPRSTGAAAQARRGAPGALRRSS